jgi:GT2 family glycosyltransferase
MGLTRYDESLPAPTGISGPLRAGPRISVLIVNHNGMAYLADCLASLQQQTCRDELEIIVVDNASTDGSLPLLERDYPDIKLLKLARNEGFAGGNNAGLRIARGRYIAFLNNDAVADRRWLESLLLAIERDGRLGGVASQVLFRSRPNVVNSAGIELYRDGRGGDRGLGQAKARFGEPAEVFGPCGAAMLLRRELIEEVGPFDAHFFLYYEDLDLAWRARLRGWRFSYEPRAIAYHVHGGTSGLGSPFFRFHVERNRVLTNVKNGPVRMAALTMAVLAAKLGRQWFRLLVLGRINEREHAVALLRAWMSMIGHLPAAVAERRRIQSTRMISPREMERLIVPAPRPARRRAG